MEERLSGGIGAALAAPFEPRLVRWKPQSVKGNRALALAYIDCRVVQDRLDDVLGVENWQDSYDIVPDGSVVCRLALKIGGEWITKTDVGSPSEQPDGGDRLKAAFSDALKRAAVKFGVGRYIYRLPNVWADYDPAKRQFVSVPQLPLWAMPKGATPDGRVPPKGGSGTAPPKQAAPPASAPKKADIKTVAELVAVVSAMPAAADGTALGERYERVAVRLDALAAGFDPAVLHDDLAAVLQLPKDKAIPFAGLSPKQVEAGWRFLKDFVKRFDLPPAA